MLHRSTTRERNKTDNAARVEVVFTAPQFAALKEHLFQANGDEQAAYAFAAPAQSTRGTRLLVHHVLPLGREDFDQQSGAYLEVGMQTAKTIAALALSERWALVEIHSHPFARSHVSFSATDLGSALPRFRWFAEHAKQDFHHVMLVFGTESVDGLVYDAMSQSVFPVERVTVLSHPISYQYVNRGVRQRAGHAEARYSRQVQAFGEGGQARLAQSRVGIVGLGGTGSFVASELAYLGVKRFTLVDADYVEATNLNRLIGAVEQDAKGNTPKTKVIARTIQRIAPKSDVQVFDQAFPTPESVQALKAADVLFGCTDTQGSRLLLNQFSLQYLIPLIDIGTGLETDGAGQITQSGGQVRVVVPGEYCLQCISAIDPIQASSDLLPATSRERHRALGYIPTEEIHAPAVVFLNGILASLAVGEFLNLLTGYQAPSQLLYYRLGKQQLLRVEATRDDTCVACGQDSRIAMGDLDEVLGIHREIPKPPTFYPNV